MANVIEKAHVDAIFGPNGDKQADDNPLNPCPVCEAVPEDSPEAVHDHVSARKHGVEFNTAKWVYDHCWRCGFRPGDETNSASVAHLRSMQNQFQRFLAENLGQYDQSRGIAAPNNADEVNDLKRQIEDLKAQMANSPKSEPAEVNSAETASEPPAQ